MKNGQSSSGDEIRDPGPAASGGGRTSGPVARKPRSAAGRQPKQVESQSELETDAAGPSEAGGTHGLVNRSVARALRLLSDIAVNPEAQSFSDLLKRHKLPKGTLHNLLLTLESQGFVRRDASTGRYRIGFTVMELAASNTASVNDLGVLLEPILEKLVAQCNETLHLAMLNGAEEFIIRRIDPREQIVRIAPQVGRRHPAHATSGGIASLALLEDAEVEALLPEQLPQLTKHTIDRRSELMKRLGEVRRLGYNLDLEEAYLGVRCVAIAIAVSGWPTISISFTLPLQRAPLEHLRSLVSPLKEAAKTIQHILAVTPHA